MILSAECLMGDSSLAHVIAEVEGKVERLYAQEQSIMPEKDRAELCNKVESICHWLLNEMRTANEQQKQNLRSKGLRFVKRQLDWLENDDIERSARKIEMLAYRLRFHNA